MEYRQLGASGLRVSEIALGNWITHGGQVGEDTARACVRAALDAGVILFDTADVYSMGEAERVLGRVLKDVERSSYVLATKCFNAMSDDPNDKGLSRKHIIESCEKSLRRLQTDYIDLYQAHRYDPEVPLEETLRAWNDLIRQGKVLYVGVSEWRAEQIRRAVEIADGEGFDRIISNQPQYSMLWRVPETEVMPLCRQEGIGQIVWSPLGMGALTGKYKPGEPPPEGSRGEQGSGIRRRYLRDDILEAVQRLRPLADESGLSMAAFAVAWVLQNDNVASAITGASRPQQVQDNMTASGVKLDPALMTEVDKILHGLYDTDPSLTG
jgi:aryl-alcohol dehydrogenase-like predicted oxidoreductase